MPIKYSAGILSLTWISPSILSLGFDLIERFSKRVLFKIIAGWCAT